MNEYNRLWGEVRSWAHGSSASVERIEELETILARCGVRVNAVDGLSDYLRPHLAPYSPRGSGPVVAALMERWLRGELQRVLAIVHEDHAGLVEAGLHDAKERLVDVGSYLSDPVVHWDPFPLGSVSWESLPGIVRWAEKSSGLNGMYAPVPLEPILEGRFHDLDLPMWIPFDETRASDGRPLDVMLCLKLSRDGVVVAFGFRGKNPSNILGSLELIELVQDWAPEFEPRFYSQILSAEVGVERGHEVAEAWARLWRTFQVLRKPGRGRLVHV